MTLFQVCVESLNNVLLFPGARGWMEDQHELDMDDLEENQEEGERKIQLQQLRKQCIPEVS